jgi:hypothetical protein
MYTGAKLIFAAVPFIIAAQALDVPGPCRTICDPIEQLKKSCDTDLPSDNDADEHRLENQCLCTNRSFDVGRVLPMCASCLQQNASPQGQDDDDDNRADAEDITGEFSNISRPYFCTCLTSPRPEINNLMSTCRLSSASYSPAATSLVQGIVVNATPLTATNQLSTITGGSTQPTGQSSAGGATATTAGRAADTWAPGCPFRRRTLGAQITSAATNHCKALQL